ncbi:MAG: septum formation initiator family protein [Microthrixaceae bacterium]
MAPRSRQTADVSKAGRLPSRRRWFWVVALAVVSLFLALMALPVRNLFSQSAELGRARAEIGELQQENTNLERRQAELEDPEQVEALARRNHGMVFPGEESYVVLPPSEGGEVPPWVAKGWDFDPSSQSASEP